MRPKMCIYSVHNHLCMCICIVQVVHIACIVSKRYCAHFVNLLFCVCNQENGKSSGENLGNRIAKP